MTCLQLVRLIDSFAGDYGAAVQFIARKHPEELETAYAVIAEMRGKDKP